MHDHEHKGHEPKKEEHHVEKTTHEVSEEVITEAHNEMPATSTEVRGAWTVFKDTYALWKGHWKVFTGIQILWAAAMLATVLVTSVLAGFALAVSGVIQFANKPEEITTALLMHPFFLGGLILGVVCVGALMLLLSTWMTLATVTAWKWVTREEHHNMSVRNAYLSTWPTVPNYLWISILAGALVVLGYIGFILPGILLTFSFAFLPAIAVVEGLKGRHAIMRTTRLARPHLITIFWRIIVAGVVLYVPGEIGKWFFNEISNGLGDALYQLYGLVVAPILTGILFVTYLEAKAVEKKVAAQSWLSLERVALIAALVAVLLIAGISLTLNW